jgi:hypothetical protein
MEIAAEYLGMGQCCRKLWQHCRSSELFQGGFGFGGGVVFFREFS